MSVDDEKTTALREEQRRYRETHSRDGYPLGSPEYPDNRAGRRRLARTWRGHRD
ncbi:MAG: hypothetical protein HOW59_02450 [Nonomuraea sp.]|nr:hypothetical protein [Nonomuraea sp.]NUQ31315.1 hypothetical protein [Dermatophilaceae bacterium]NUR81060.1 hypothetical protein [Dermatophilaceae bacterium]